MSSADFEVIVIGGGHAGCEAAHASARMGRRTALVCIDPTKIGFMSCNPAIGGLAKGQLVKEIDALGGIMGRITDRAAIQYRRLNSSKGPAVRSSRAQCDKALYAVEMQRFLGTVENLTILPGEATGLRLEGSRLAGVMLADGSLIRTRTAVITSGTFLGAVMFTGFSKTEGGRIGEAASKELSATFRDLGLKLRRLKTGTPPRLHRDSIPFEKLEAQPGDERPLPFSFYEVPDPFPYLEQVSCYITYTNPRTHEVIAENFDRSPMFTGLIEGVGPRYCPSIEDKVKRFNTKERHQIFLEPEGLSTPEIYVNGVSTSLPADVQEKFIRTIDGLENAQFTKYGYAVEYDAVDARGLRRTLESKEISGLFFAGQVNGTSGYEEAGAQGLIAGINAARVARGEDEFVLERADGYAGVMVDDLTTTGADEPYRMFTSRAEFRLLLREDNADLRLSERGHQLGLLGDDAFRKFTAKREAIETWRSALKTAAFSPSPEMAALAEELGSGPVPEKITGENLLKRPAWEWNHLARFGFPPSPVDPEVAEQVQIQIKYDGYIRRETELWERVQKNDRLRIPKELDFDAIPGLSAEMKGRLAGTRPETLGQVSRMVGSTPAAVANLLIHIRMMERHPHVGSA